MNVFVVQSTVSDIEKVRVFSSLEDARNHVKNIVDESEQIAAEWKSDGNGFYRRHPTTDIGFDFVKIIECEVE